MDASDLPRVLAIAGPTASGKSALALRVADALDAEVVNADALQVYAGLRVLTARPTDAEMAAVPHHLFGHMEPSERYSVGAWSRDAVKTLADIHARGRRALLVGGTGLYFKALFDGLAEVPEPSEEAKARADAMSLGELQDMAQSLDPIAAQKIEPEDRQRLRRIVAVALGTGKPLSVWQDETHPLVTEWAGVVVETDRKALYARIDARFDHMLDAGGLEEARALATRGLDPMLPALKAIGVAEMLVHLRGDLDRDAAVALAQRNSRRLAKRQMTWFRNQTPHWPRVERAAKMEDVVAAFRVRAGG